MPLPYEHTSMVNRLGHTSLEHKCLQPTLKKALNSQCQDIIKLVLVLFQQTIPIHSSQKGLTLKDSAGIFLIQSEKHSSIITDAAQSILNPPQLPLASEPIFPYKLQLSIQTLLLIWSTWFLESLPIYNTPDIQQDEKTDKIKIKS